MLSVPDKLTCFLLGILTGDAENKKPSGQVEIMMESFRQDIIYAASCGKQKPPKHILLAYAVKTLTGNVELLQNLS